MKEGIQDKLAEYISVAFVLLFAFLCVVPYIYVVSDSLEPYTVYLKNPAALFPQAFSLEAYRQLMNISLFFSGFRVTVFITVIGTAFGVFLLLISAYPLSKPHLKGRNLILTLITFTMFFNGGLIPNYYVIRGLGMLNTPWALIFPGLLSAYNLLVMKNFIANIPSTLEEAAIIDGANEITILFKIIFPLSLPAVATFAVFLSVGYWNSYFNAIIYTTRRGLWPLMLILRELVIEDNTNVASQGMADPSVLSSPYTLQMAAIVIATIPILCVYPFAQKYFAKGVMLGSVKG